MPSFGVHTSRPTQIQRRVPAKYLYLYETLLTLGGKVLVVNLLCSSQTEERRQSAELDVQGTTE